MTTSTEFPWHLGVNDAHCHPTDTMDTVSVIPNQKISQMAAMATRLEDQSLVVAVCTRYPDKVIPSFGYHPWFSHLIWDDGDQGLRDMAGKAERKKRHYHSVLAPEPPDEVIEHLPEPIALSTALADLRERLKAFPAALVGEIGLDRGFRIPDPTKRLSDEQAASGRSKTLSKHKVKLDHQRLIFRSQLLVAGEFARPVSVHGVACHGAVFDSFRDLWRGHEKHVEEMHEIKRRRRKVAENAYEYLPDGVDSDSDPDADILDMPTKPSDKMSGGSLQFPPRICLHSFSAPPEQLEQYLRRPAPGLRYPSEIFFSYSATINTSPTRGHLNKLDTLVERTPDSAILVESDLHTAGQQQDDALEAAVRYIAEKKGWGLNEAVTRLNDNWKRFAYGG